MNKRAVGIVRVSQVAGRSGESFASPSEQRERIEQACERDELELIDVHEELDVSGGKPLDARPGLSAAVESVERGDAQVVAAAYFDRLFRSLTTQAEVIDRVERAGGQVLAVDVGRVTNGTAGQWLSGTMLGAVAEYYRRSSGERIGAAQARAIARGVPIGPVPPGYLRDSDKRYIVDPVSGPIVRDAFQMRANGESVESVRMFLREHGIERSEAGVRKMFRSRLYRGEIHYGDLEPNLSAHEPLVDCDVFERASKANAPRGRLSKRPHLLARLGVLRCGSCGSRMVVGTQRRGEKTYSFYWCCCPRSDCEHRVAIQTHIVEDVVWRTVRDAMRDAQGRANALSGAETALSRLSRLSSAQEGYESALRVFSLSGAENEPAAIERLNELRAVRDDAQAEVDRLKPTREVIVDDPDSLDFDLRRKAIQLAVRRAVVAPGGRGAERITVELAL